MIIFLGKGDFIIIIVDYRGGDTKRGEGGLIKVKKQVDYKIHFG